MMHFASHPSRRTTDRVPLAELDALGVLTPRTKLAHMVYVDDADIALLARRGVERLTINHPILGNNTIPQLLRIMVAHEQRHHEQIGRVRAAAGFPRNSL